MHTLAYTSITFPYRQVLRLHKESVKLMTGKDLPLPLQSEPYISKSLHLDMALHAHRAHLHGSDCKIKAKQLLKAQEKLKDKVSP